MHDGTSKLGGKMDGAAYVGSPFADFSSWQLGLGDGI
jgi:hypothetical protein